MEVIKWSLMPVWWPFLSGYISNRCQLHLVSDANEYSLVMWADMNHNLHVNFAHLQLLCISLLSLSQLPSNDIASQCGRFRSFFRFVHEPAVCYKQRGARVASALGTELWIRWIVKRVSGVDWVKFGLDILAKYSDDSKCFEYQYI